MQILLCMAVEACCKLKEQRCSAATSFLAFFFIFICVAGSLGHKGWLSPFSRSLQMDHPFTLGVQLQRGQLHLVLAMLVVHNLPEVAAAQAMPMTDAIVAQL